MILDGIFVAKKPLFVSSNGYLGFLKRRDGAKKAGFSGILDPFACGVLVVAYGQYTRLFPFLKKTPKVYQATLWLGLESDSLDIENIQRIHQVKIFSKEYLKEVLQKFCGKIGFIPPKYSAKKINGKKAYELARAGKEVVLKEQTMEIFKIEFLNYSHPFLSFKVWVSEGSYIRSLGEMIARELGCLGGLSYLERLSEGGLHYEDEKLLNPLEILDLPKVLAINNGVLKEKVQNGKQITQDELQITKDGKYIVQFEDFFSIISNQENKIQYLANRIPLC
ncbi:tRNA pseudouridine(55) synthase TruB [Helicobacter canadensis]|uniref:tRNA pseudouridine synthase B n=1 Tax=Helicobacter canadensis MIT 98-5491 TaxID=537970 RepID=C5ZWM4_9HELI|nr:tRNA pseudouridine(55) synthase TruB [Helicobacter canadensis]EES89542.1 tRNA pseudouridine synthase B [Helicobacter canadensis MIT 98-5491]EFR48333.1 tRNA pseudouridine synthase B [Helicobacter canadensis MIT 98-5491]STO99579.1 tRNA pseudouridine synthase B [Helicobacter canadensis]